MTFAQVGFPIGLGLAFAGTALIVFVNSTHFSERKGGTWGLLSNIGHGFLITGAILLLTSSMSI